MSDLDRQAYAWQLPHDAGARENLAAAVYADGTRHVRVKAGVWYNYLIGIGNPGGAANAPGLHGKGKLSVTYDATTLARFWAKVDKSGDCWIYTGTPSAKRPRFHLGRRFEPASHIAYTACTGPIPPGHFVLHTCDTPRCVNPAHLFTGTHQDNMEDMKRKGRQAAGERNPAAKLSNAQAREIRARLAAGEVGAALAREFGVTRAMVSYIKLGRWWRDDAA